MTLKVVGYQWFWGYSYPDHGIEEFTANMVPEADLKEGEQEALDRQRYAQPGRAGFERSWWPRFASLAARTGRR